MASRLFAFFGYDQGDHSKRLMHARLPGRLISMILKLPGMMFYRPESSVDQVPAYRLLQPIEVQA